MRRIKFSLRNLILFVTMAGVYLGYSQARRHSSRGVAQTLDDYGYVVNTPNRLCDLIWQRSPRVQRNYGAPKFHPLLEHWWQMSPETLTIQFDIQNNADDGRDVNSPSEETMEVLRLGARLKALGAKEILVDVAYRNELMAFQKFESQSLALENVKLDRSTDEEHPAQASRLAKRRARKEGAHPENQDAIPRSIASQTGQEK